MGGLHSYNHSNLLGLIPGLTSARLPTRVPSAHMSTGPAGDGKENLIYVALVGAACIGGGVYVSKHNKAQVTNVDTCNHYVEDVGQVFWGEEGRIPPM